MMLCGMWDTFTNKHDTTPNRTARPSFHPFPVLATRRSGSVEIGSGDDPHMTGSLSQLVVELSKVANDTEASSRTTQKMTR